MPLLQLPGEGLQRFARTVPLPRRLCRTTVGMGKMAQELNSRKSFRHLAAIDSR